MRLEQERQKRDSMGENRQRRTFEGRGKEYEEEGCGERLWRSQAVLRCRG